MLILISKSHSLLKENTVDGWIIAIHSLSSELILFHVFFFFPLAEENLNVNFKLTKSFSAISDFQDSPPYSVKLRCNSKELYVKNALKKDALQKCLILYPLKIFHTILKNKYYLS